MAYSQIQCVLHGRRQCRTCTPYLQHQCTGAVPGRPHVDQGEQHAPSTLDHYASTAVSSVWSTPGGHALHAAGSADARADATALAFPSPVQNSMQNRRQIQQRFDDLHMGASNNARAIFNYQALDSTNVELRATISAMDTICIAQIATSFNDQDLMLNARIMYGKTISYLRARLESVASGRLDRNCLEDVVGAVHVLTACSWFNCLDTDSLEWVRHTQALLKILEVYGWGSLNPATARSFYMGWKYRAFLESLTQKRRLTFREPPKTIDISNRSTCFLTDYAIEIPGLLWRSQKMFQQAHLKKLPRRTVLGLLTEMEKCVAKLKQWHLQWTRTFGPRPHYRTVATKTFRHFAMLAGDLITVFPTAYDFTYPHHERDFRMMCICLLHLDQAIINIHRAFPEFCTGNEFNLQLRSAEYDADTCATNLCMLIPWTTQPQNNSFASVHAQRPLDYAMRYYQSLANHEPQLRWCRRILESLREKYGINIKYSG